MTAKFVLYLVLDAAVDKLTDLHMYVCMHACTYVWLYLVLDAAVDELYLTMAIPHYGYTLYSTPLSMSWLISRCMKDTGSITHSGPTTLTLPGVSRPEGQRWKSYLIPARAWRAGWKVSWKVCEEVCEEVRGAV